MVTHAQSRMLHSYGAKIKVTTKLLTREAAHGNLTEVTYARYRHAKTIHVPQRGPKRHTCSSSFPSNKSSNSTYSNNSRGQFTQATTVLRSGRTVTEHAQSISCSSEFQSLPAFSRRGRSNATQNGLYLAS